MQRSDRVLCNGSWSKYFVARNAWLQFRDGHAHCHFAVFDPAIQGEGNG